MNHCGTYTIETKRLLLREFMVEDAEAMFQNWASDKEVTKFLTWPAYTSLDTAIHIFDYSAGIAPVRNFVPHRASAL